MRLERTNNTGRTDGWRQTIRAKKWRLEDGEEIPDQSMTSVAKEKKKKEEEKEKHQTSHSS